MEAPTEREHVDWGGLVREAWRLAFRTRPLLGLSAITALQAVALIVMSGGVVALFVVVLIQAFAPAGAGSPTLVQSLASLWPALMASALGLMAVWLVLAVFDVAARPGLITQTLAASDGRAASIAAGLGDGFRIWWRTVGLLAIAAMPGLIYALVLSIGLLFVVSLPMYLGNAPDPVVLSLANSLSQPLGGLVSLVAIPLGVLSQLGLRYAAAEDLHWRPAFSAAWVLAKARFADVALVYLLLVALIGIVGLGLAIVLGILGLIAAAVTLAFGAGAGGPSAAAVMSWVVCGVLGAVTLFVFQVYAGAFSSVMYTMFWVRVSGSLGSAEKSLPIPGGAGDSRVDRTASAI
jgi:hypothetical protein